MNIRVISLLILFLAAFGLRNISFAVPAAPVEYILTQADGARFHARQWGDEWSHGWETRDGYSIVFDSGTRNWTYSARDAIGRLSVSDKIVGKDIPSRLAIRHLRPAGSAKANSASISSSALSGGPYMGPPLSGTGYIPVILVNFSDRATSYTAADFDTLLFGTANKSMKDYYQEVSYGSFSVSAGPGGIAGWYAASNTHDYYGQNDAGGSDTWPGTLVREAVAAADASFNFAPYDQDGDCYVDVVNIVHQGSGEEAGGPAADIWSHRWDLNSADYFGYSNGGEYTTNDACPAGGFIKVDDYVIQPETLWGGMQTVGVFAHEYGHALGLPDLYDTDNSSEGIGNWCLMASGSWNYVTNAGDTPAHMSAWNKSFLGWVTPAEVNGTLTNEPIGQVATTTDIYKLLTSSLSEYFLVENRQKTGFDAGLPGAGLLIWHIDESKTNNNSECYPPSSCALNHYMVSLEQADGLWNLEHNTNRGDIKDPFPGSTNNTSFTDSSSPNSKLYNGTSSGVSVANVSASGTTMTATLTAQYMTVYSDGFEDGSLGPAWSTTNTNEGRIQFTTNYSPHSGNYHITMDDTTNNGTYSLNELVLTVDLAGRTGVTMSFYHKEFGDEDHAMPASFTGSNNSDGVAISADGNTWYKLQGLAGADGISSSYKQFTANLDSAIASAGISYTSNFKIKFQHYDNAPIISNDGFSFDDIKIRSSVPQCTDNDGDGYGNPGDASCSNGSQTDCNDSNNLEFPGQTWYEDADGDGYSSGNIIAQCGRPADYYASSELTATSGDYNDNDPNIYPGGPPVRDTGTVTSYYDTLQAAYNASAGGDTIQSQAAAFTEDLNINVNKTITLQGGYDNGYIVVTGKTTLNGNMTISNGTVTIENFILQ